MQITCPHCEKLNNINLSRKIKCGNCKGEILEYKEDKYNFSSGALLTTLSLAIGGGWVINELLEENRYPIDIEYSLIEYCSSSDDTILNTKEYKSKLNLCICAVRKTEEVVSIDELESEIGLLLKEMKQNLKTCGELTSTD